MQLKYLFPTILFASTMALAAPSMAAPDPQIRVEFGKISVRIATTSPPRYNRYDRRGPRRDNQMWIRGYWHLDDNRWVWRNGRWEDRRNDRAWIHPSYERENGVVIYTPGRWSNQSLSYDDDYEEYRKRHNRKQNRGVNRRND